MQRLLRAGLAACTLALLAACASNGPGSERAVVKALSAQLVFQYHECVPLGWEPMYSAGTYYPGYTASVQNYAEFLDAIWRGRIDDGEMKDPATTEVARVLDHLTAAGLLTRQVRVGRIDYGLTPNAFPYYYGSEEYGNNHDSLPYLCYSTVVPTRIAWIARIAPPSWRRRSKAQWYRASFEWKASEPAAWARDPFLRAHSVTLAPLSSPTTVMLVFARGTWSVLNIYDRGWMLPALSHPNAWVSARLMRVNTAANR